MGLGGALHGPGLAGAMHGTGIHKFDTALGLPQRTTIRRGVIDRLSELLKPGGYVATIIPIPRLLRGEGDEDGEGMVLRATQGQSPAIAVALGRKTYEATDGESELCQGELVLGVYFVSEHNTDVVEGRLEMDVVGAGDATADPGLEALMEHVEELLLGQELNIRGVSEIRPVQEDEVATFADATIWEQTYSIKVMRDIVPSRKSTRFMTSIQGDHKLDGIDSPGPMSPLVRTVAELEE